MLTNKGNNNSNENENHINANNNPPTSSSGRRKRELFIGSNNRQPQKQLQGQQQSNNEDSGLSFQSIDSPPSPSILPTNLLQVPSTSTGIVQSRRQQQQHHHVPVMDAEQWARLNEQIKQICLDCTRHFAGPHEPQRTCQQHRQPASMSLANSQQVVHQMLPQTSASSNISAPKSVPKSILSKKQMPEVLPEVSPSPPVKKSSFSMPRLFHSRAKDKHQQQKRPTNLVGTGNQQSEQQQLDLLEQHSPTTTTSAYGTGGGTDQDTGQESPPNVGAAEKYQLHKQQQQRIQNGGTGGEKNNANSSEDIDVKQQKASRTQKSVKFASKPPSGQQILEESPQLPDGVFYTSAERLAEMLEQQQRLLRQELLNGVGTGGGSAQQKMLALPPHSVTQSLPHQQRHATKPSSLLIRVPISQSPMRTSPSVVKGAAHSSMPSTPTLPFPPSQKPTIMQSACAQRKLPPVPMPMKTAVANPMMASSSPSPHQPSMSAAMGRLKGTSTLDNIFVFKPNMPQQQQQMQQQQQCATQPHQPAHAVPSAVQAQQQVPLQRRKSKSPVKKLQHELEWVVKRRPDGTRYVTRRPLHRPKAALWSANVKARREQSLIRERHHSGAASTTTDEDAATTSGGEQLALVNRLWQREQQRRQRAHPRHRGGGEGSSGARETAADRVVSRQPREWWLQGGGEANILPASDDNVDNSALLLFGGGRTHPPQKQPLYSASLERRLEATGNNRAMMPPPAPHHHHPPNAAHPPHPQSQHGRGHSLPGQAMFSVTTV